MPDSVETPPPAAPPPPADQNNEPSLEEWNPENVAKAFDQVMPSTAPKREPRAPSQPAAPVPPVAPEAPVAPAPPALPTAPASILPEELFGEIPKAAPAAPVEDDLSKKEYPAPDKIKSDPAQYANWNELHRSEERNKTLAARLSKEVEDLKTKTAPPDEGLQARLTQLEEENKSFKERQYALDLQSDPEYQKVFIHGRRRLVEGGAEILRDAGLEPDAFKQAMELNGRAKTEALDEIIESVTSPTVRGELTAIIKDVNSLDRSKHQALADSKTTVEKLRQNARAQEFKALQEHTKFLDSTVDTVVDRLANVSKIGFFRKIEGNETWNKQVDEIINDTRDIVKNSTNFEQLTGTVALGRAAVPMYNALVAINREYQKVLKENQELKGAEPGFEGQRKIDTGEETELPKGLSFAEAVAQRSGLR